MIEPGNYEAKPTSAQLGYAQSGTEQVAIQFRTKNGYHITWYGYFTEKTAKTTIASLRTCGWTGNDIADLSSIETKPQDVELIIEQEDDQQGNPRARVRWVNRIGGGVALARPMNAGQLAAFADRMRGKVIAEAQANPQSVQPTGGSGPSRSYNDDDGDDYPRDTDGLGF
jgi:hypothetical protein